MMEIPETFDWVPARAKCSAAEMFALLVMRIESDVTVRQDQLKNTNYVFSVKKIAADSVVVARQYIERGVSFRGRNVMFKRTPMGMAVDALVVDQETSPRPMFTASVSLGPEGRCRYVVDGQPLELWQVSQKALDGLFFNED
jgi:hypothetical protein